MNPVLSHLLAVVVGGGLVIAAFVFFNIKSPDKVDEAEAVIRKIKK